MAEARSHQMTTDAKTRLTDLLRRKARESPFTKAEFVRWLDDVRALVKQVHEWLDELVQERTLVVTDGVEDVPVVLSGKIHTYSFPTLRIAAADGSTVHLRPIALRVAGANGRVDLARGGRLVKVLRGADGKWSILDENAGLARTSPLDEDSFLKALLSLLE
jgi:hypothetical protein